MDLKKFWKENNAELPTKCVDCKLDMEDMVCPNLKDTCINCCGEDH